MDFDRSNEQLLFTAEEQSILGVGPVHEAGFAFEAVRKAEAARVTNNRLAVASRLSGNNAERARANCYSATAIAADLTAKQLQSIIRQHFPVTLELELQTIIEQR